jgi:hypothetical protein
MSTCAGAGNAHHDTQIDPLISSESGGSAPGVCSSGAGILPVQPSNASYSVVGRAACTAVKQPLSDVSMRSS